MKRRTREQQTVYGIMLFMATMIAWYFGVSGIVCLLYWIPWLDVVANDMWIAIGNLIGVILAIVMVVASNCDNDERK